MSLRRSARALLSTAIGVKNESAQATSSTSSGARGERGSRSAPQEDSSHDNESVSSRVSELREELPETGGRKTRRSADEKRVPNRDPEVGPAEESEEEEEETRCICGHAEYPGLPLISRDSEKQAQVFGHCTVPEDATGWFIQCDNCQVWQHGGCVGILDESQSPETYYCETCRKDLHRISLDLNGRKYSRYKRAIVPKRSASPQSSSVNKVGRERLKRERRTSRTALEDLGRGRRATLNSRESAYDEAEQLKRAIEASKQDSLPQAAVDKSSQRAKRSRSTSDSVDTQAKRQRTGSDSNSHRSKKSQTARMRKNGETNGQDELEVAESSKDSKKKEDDQPEEDLEQDHNEDEDPNAEGSEDAEARHLSSSGRDRRSSQKGGRHARSTRTSQKSKKTKEESPEDHDAANEQDAVQRDDSPTPEPLQRTSRSNGKTGDVGKVGVSPPGSSRAQRRGGRPIGRRGRYGRNQQLVKQRPDGQDQGSNASPQRGNSADPHQNNEGVNTSSTDRNVPLLSAAKSSCPRHMNPNRTTLNDMRRRVAGILEFISHTQVEMASLGTNCANVTQSSEKSEKQANTVVESDLQRSVDNHVKGAAEAAEAAEAAGEAREVETTATPADPEKIPDNKMNPQFKDLQEVKEAEFANLTSVEMMEVLSRRLIRWQNEFGKYGEK